MKSPYATAPLNLDPSTPQFRLLKLHPRTSSSTISCTLSSYLFDGHHPAYKALSYTWGLKAKPHSILLNGIESHVGRSLWTFLDQMCLQGQHGVYWIDAICIDQDSTLEKNHQVQMMRRIYSTAEKVVVWLGESNQDEMSDTAMGLLAGPISWVEADTPTSPGHIHGPKFMSILSILERDYWSRIWIVQEIMVAKRILVYCGSKSLEWQSLTDYMTYLSEESEKRWKGREDVRFEWDNRALQLIYAKEHARTTEKKSTLAELLTFYTHYKATNVLDKVYALCGLASDADKVIIDYDISPRDLVTHVIDTAPYNCSELHSELQLHHRARAVYGTLGFDVREYTSGDFCKR